ncbi:hypothetical protein N7G274_003130 [Stereocaulon virgatum]|uniref:non-specific serine/threonine protein kinase n=1 Tax=Stereocaulon virgatum TaxID=373712 RepID=A0ABR4AG50_9LECA
MTSKPHSESAAKRAGALYCEVDAEPLERYRKGGYHPTHLGDIFKDGRYKIIHKLGWGGYATVWLARDFLLSRHVAIKILVSELWHDSHEVRILEHLLHGPASHPGKKRIIQLLDRFEHEGPNGTHPCLVFEPLGPSVVSEAELYTSNRLPGKVAWEASRQTIQALAYIHASGIAHGDLHPGNIIFANTTSYQSDTDLLKSLGEPQMSDVIPSSGHSLTAQVPKYLVLPTSPPFVARDFESCQVKLVDFGEAFSVGQQRQIRCPLVFRAPEAFLTSQWDLQVDIWSLGCTIFELVVGYPPFDNFMPNKDDLIREWVSMFGDLPEEWREGLPSPRATEDLESERVTLRDWLHETYFDDDRKQDFSRADIDSLGTLLQSVMQYYPSDRPRASDLLNHTWFQRNPFTA